VSLRAVLDSYPNGAIVVFDRDLRYVAAGGRGLADVGLSVEMLEGKLIWEVFPPATAAEIEPVYRAALAGTESVCDVPYGGRIYFQHAAPLLGCDGEITGGIVATHEITELRASADMLRVAEEQFRLAFEHAPIGKALVALDGRFTRVNRSLCELLGYDEAALLDKTFQDITHPDDLQIDLGHVERLLAGEIQSYRMEKRYFDNRGRIVWVQLSGALVRDAQGAPVQFIAQIEDIGQRKRDEEQLTQLAQRDPLTGLLNRAMLDRDLAAYRRAAERYGDKCSVLLIDLDRFKAVNDQAGHEAGDEMLRQVAQSIRSRVRITDHVYRLGGDEFVVLVPHADPAAIAVLVEALRASISRVEIVAGNRKMRVGASIGVGRIEGVGEDRALSDADRSMYADKSRRSGGREHQRVVV
jgi:diguanylate cyclase (GGDEF)-like protein/PAS domain S-box-containing protein